MRYNVEFEGYVIYRDDAASEVRLPTPQELEDLLDLVMEELDNIGAPDPTISAEASGATVEIGVSVDAASPQDAVEAGFGFIRTAVHAAGGATPGWRVDWMRVEAERSPTLEEAPSGDEELVAS